MLKTISIIFLVVFLCCCSSSSKINTSPLVYENELFKFSYPDYWKTYIDHGHLSVSPKKYLRSNNNRYYNIFDIIEYSNSNSNVKPITIESLIENEIVSAKNYAEETIFYRSVIQTDYGDVIVIKMDKKHPTQPLKELIHYYAFNNTIYALKYSVINNDFQNHIGDAMFIFNSFEIKK